MITMAKLSGHFMSHLFGNVLPALLLTAGLFCSSPLQAQQTHIDEISVDTRATFHQQTEDGVYDSHFQGDYFNIHMKGHLTDNISFRIRQRMNKKVDEQNPFNATDFLWINWQASTKWSFTLGKQGILVGGYEFDSPPIEVYYYSAFLNHLYQYYAFGAAMHYTYAPDQHISFQFSPSPVSSGLQDAYSYNLYWSGRPTEHWKTLWSVNIVEDQYHRKMNYIALGNKFPLGALVVDLDLMNRASFHQERFFFSDWTVIMKAIWTVGKWNLCTKVGYEENDAANVDELGISYDTALPAGHNYLYGGCGVEYFPLGNDNLRLHAVYFRDNHDHVNNYDIGMTWRFNIYKR